MCGDLDEDQGELEKKLVARFVHQARAMLAQSSPGGSEPPADLNQYLDTLFADVLSRVLRDAERADAAQRYERLAMQPVVLARLAGFLAAHLSLAEDPLRKVIEAVMLGYSDAEAIEEAPEQPHHHGDVIARS